MNILDFLQAAAPVINQMFNQNDADNAEEETENVMEFIYHGVKCKIENICNRADARKARLQFVLVNLGFFYNGKINHLPQYQLRVSLGSSFLGEITFSQDIIELHIKAVNYLKKKYQSNISAFDITNKNSVLGFIKWYFYYSQYTEFTEIKA